MTAAIEHLTQVGISKAMGLLHFSEIAALGHCQNCLAERFSDQNLYIVRRLKTLWRDPLPEEEGVLALGSVPMLRDLLKENALILKRTGWPAEPSAFMDRTLDQYVCTSDSRYAPALQILIKKAFNHTACNPMGEYAARVRLVHALCDVWGIVGSRLKKWPQAQISRGHSL